MTTRRNWLTAVALLTISFGIGGCGDKFGIGAFPRIQVLIDGQTIDEEGTVNLAQAIQTVVTKELEIINPGNNTLTIDGIDWARGADGKALKNKYVEIDWRGAIGADSFPFPVEPDAFAGLTIAVKFTPPLGFALDDFSDSVLVISSDARNNDGSKAVAELRVIFRMTQDLAVPRVTPTNYKFTNATPAKPERQDFHIYNDEQQATTSFRVLSIALETPSDEFRLLNLPSAGAVVLAPGDSQYEDLVFTVEYQPKDDAPDTNAIIIQTDVASGGSLRVPLSTGLITGAYSLSYSSPNKFDFTNVTSKEKRSVVIVSEGPGPITVKQPKIEPAEAGDDFKMTAWLPATTAGGQDTAITSWPRGVQAGKSIRIDIEYSPSNDGSDTANGQLVIAYESPDLGSIVIDLFSGDPKSKIALAPNTGNVFVTGDRTSGATGKRHVVIYNEGNGPLEVKDIAVKANFDMEPVVYSLAQAFQPFTVAPGGVRVVELSYNLAGVPNDDTTVSEIFQLTYLNDFTNQNEVKTLGLIAAHDHGLTSPTADPGSAASYASAVAGEAMTLVGSGSSAGGGTFGAGSHIWYLTAKPASSTARLNTQGAAAVSFLPDVAGSYTVELVVFAQSGDTYLYSPAASVTFTAAAP